MIFKLQPTRVYRSYFGGQNLDAFENKDNPEISRFPEDWLASVTEAFNPDRQQKNEGLSVTEDGQVLKDIIEADKKAMIGDRENMSLLFKLLDSAERLVIQAHPTKEFAQKHFNSPYGKTECWYILNDGGEVYIGFKEGITRDLWKDFFEKQDVEKMLSCLHKFKVNKGDFIFVAGGVPHAIGKNCFLAELQEPTDLMVIPEKVTPSGVVLAEQKLHGGLGFDKMFDCFNYDGLSEFETRQKYFLKPERKNEFEVELLNCAMFKLSQIDVSDDLIFDPKTYGIAVVIEGFVSMNGIGLKQGDRVFISEKEKLFLNGNGKLLLCRP